MSAPAEWQRIRDLFHRALDLPAEERAAFVRRQTASEPAVREQVESLLHAHDEAGGFLSHAATTAAHDAVAQPPHYGPGTKLAAFEILGLLGAGGMGEVYRARDTRLDRDVAIKVLAGDLATDPHSRERLEREARAVSRLSHPHICTLYDVGEADVDGTRAKYLVMELIEGETLAKRLLRGPLPTAQAIQIALETLDALSTAHAAGIIHRDLKPANIMLTKAGVKLLDFGVARLRPASSPGMTLAAADPLTATGLVFGTMPYLAPEQARGEEADARSDLFAFGAVFYEMLSGRRAFAAPSGPALIAAILERDPPPLGVEAPLKRLLAGCLAKDPAERWQHAGDVALALRTIADGDPSSLPEAGTRSAARTGPPASRVWRVHAVWAAVAILASAAVWARDSRSALPVPTANPTPVIVLMDSPLEGRVYDPRTLAEGGTNADDITDALRGLPIVIHKENTSPMWHREEQVRQQNPDLIVSHLSCLFDQRVSNDPPIRQHFFDMAQTRLVGFFGYVATVNPHTRFLVYSRGRFGSPEGTWSTEVLTRFPQLTGRLFTLTVPGGEKATFRDPAIMSELRQRVEGILALRSSAR
jgi:serine/threonine protein kinase